MGQAALTLDLGELRLCVRGTALHLGAISLELGLHACQLAHLRRGWERPTRQAPRLVGH